MGLTTSGLSSRASAEKGEGHIHTDKWHRCTEHVKAQGHTMEEAAAICTNSIGYRGSVNPEHRARAKKVNPYHGPDGRVVSGGHGQTFNSRAAMGFTTRV